MIETVVAVAQAIGVVELAERAVDQVVLVERVRISVVAVLEAIRGCRGAGIDPVLIDDLPGL